jgi:radical SAM superfamily enzyme YgiQ (UPF0313 family)
MAHVTMIRPPFVGPRDMINQTEGTPSLGLAYLLGSLKAHGHQVSAIDAFGEDVNRFATITNSEAKGVLINGIGAEQIVSMIPEHTDVIGITCMFSNEWLYARHIINTIKLNFPKIPIIAGGEHITAESYRSMISTPALTACALGEGEETINDLVDTLVARQSLAEVRGIAYFDDAGNYCKTERRVRIRNLDDIPLPSWDEIPIENYLDAGLGNGTLQRRTLPMLASRGCPYTCTFCSSASMWGIRWVSRNPRLVVDEIKSYIARYRINHIDFNDLTTVINRKWIIEFCKLLISENLAITWSLSSGTRSEALDHEVLDYMKRAGIERITYAPESGSDKTLERVKKKVDLQNMTGSIRASVKVGIYSRANLIFGLPDQTVSESLESVAFAMKLCVLGMYDIACMCFAPYPGSELFERMIREGKISTSEAYDEFLVNNLTTKVTGMRSWSEHIPNWSMPLWTIGTTILFYSLQFLLRPNRFIKMLYRLIKKNPTTMFETIVYGLFISLFKRRKLVVNEVAPIDKIKLPDDNWQPRRLSDDPLILIASGNPQRGLI